VPDVAPEWWEEFFTGPWLEVQRTVWDERRTRDDADRIDKLLGLPEGSAILDVPCGEGRISRELASRGYRVTGVDVTEALLDDGRRLSRGAGLDVSWEQRDMRDLPWTDEFDGAVNFGGSFGYFDDEGNLAFAEAVAKALKAGGRFLIETFTVETLLPHFQERWWDRHAGILVLEDRTYQHAQGRIEAEWTFLGQDEEPVVRSSSIRLYTYSQLCQMLEAVGFASFEGYDSLTREPFAFGAKRLTLVATKG
jgi:SAM-dependent methyltransferase